MKHKLLVLCGLSAILIALAACSKDEGSDTPLYRNDTIEYDANRKILIAYFSWGGNTQHLAEEIADMTGGTLFRIETVNPYRLTTTSVRWSHGTSWITAFALN